MFTKAFNAIFMTRPFWNEVNVPQRLVLKIYKEYLGTKNMIITSRAESIKYISPIVNRLNPNISRKATYLLIFNPHLVFSHFLSYKR